MTTKWYYRLGNTEIGPISSGGLRQQVVGGTISPDTLLRQGVEGNWIPAKHVSGLFGASEHDDLSIPEDLNRPTAERPVQEAPDVPDRPAPPTSVRGASPNHWYYKVGRIEIGPVSMGGLGQKAVGGTIFPDTPVRNGTHGDWIHARDVVGLFDSDDDFDPPAPGPSQDPVAELPNPSSGDGPDEPDDIVVVNKQPAVDQLPVERPPVERPPVEQPPVDSGPFDPYHTWLGIPAEQQPPNHYRLLGIRRFESNPDVIQNAADRQMAHLHSRQIGKHGRFSQQVLNEVAAAKICLLRPEQKAAYDRQLRRESKGKVATRTRWWRDLLSRHAGLITTIVATTLLLVTAVIFAVEYLGHPQPNKAARTAEVGRTSTSLSPAQSGATDSVPDGNASQDDDAPAEDDDAPAEDEVGPKDATVASEDANGSPENGDDEPGGSRIEPKDAGATPEETRVGRENGDRGPGNDDTPSERADAGPEDSHAVQTGSRDKNVSRLARLENVFQRQQRLRQDRQGKQAALKQLEKDLQNAREERDALTYKRRQIETRREHVVAGRIPGRGRQVAPLDRELNDADAKIKDIGQHIARAASEIDDLHVVIGGLSQESDRLGRELFWLCDPFGKLCAAAHRRTIDTCNEWIMEDNRQPWPYLARGFASLNLQQWDAALSDFEAAQQRDPRVEPLVATARAYSLKVRGQTRQAHDQFDQIIRRITASREDLDPADGAIKPAEARELDKALEIVLLFRGYGCRARGDCSEARKWFEKAAKLPQGSPAAYEALGWLYATCHIKSLRNGKKAVRNAEEAYRLAQQRDYRWHYLDTLAAAYARDARFDEAVKWANRALEEAPDEQKPVIGGRIERYRRRQPYQVESVDK